MSFSKEKSTPTENLLQMQPRRSPENTQTLVLKQKYELSQLEIQNLSSKLIKTYNRFLEKKKQNDILRSKLKDFFNLEKRAMSALETMAFLEVGNDYSGSMVTFEQPEHAIEGDGQQGKSNHFTNVANSLVLEQTKHHEMMKNEIKQLREQLETKQKHIELNIESMKTIRVPICFFQNF